MAQQGFRSVAGNPFVYQENDTATSAAMGIKLTDEVWKLVVNATAGAAPTGTAKISVDPAVAGDITITPNRNVVISTLGIGVVLSSATGTISSETPGVSGTVLMSNGAALAPSWQALPPGGLTWSVITANQTAAVDNGYICNKGSALELALPTTCAVGKVVRAAGMNTALGVKITQAANQTIHWDATNSTTVGAGGYLQSTDKYDAVELVCSVADLEFIVVSSKGNWTIV